jgi:O-antigen/teichoic acid export membrane protein
VVNAAREFAVQIQTAVQQFVGNFQMALNPQITKTFAADELQQMHTLMYRSSRFSFFLLYMLALPVMIEAPFILALWLKDVPENTAIFTRLMLMASLISATAGSCVVANQATGRVKQYQAIVGGILLLSLPFSYLALRFGASAYVVFVVAILIEILAQVARLWLLRPLIKLSVRIFLIKVYAPIALVLLTSLPLPLMVWFALSEGWMRFIAVGVVCVLSVGVCTMIFGLSKGERDFIFVKVRQFLKR